MLLAERYPEARLILAHAAVSDLAWLWREMPSHPNLFIDTSWWNPGDMMALFSLVPSEQILWASDSPYTQPLTAIVLHMRFALQAGIEPDALRAIAGGTMERILAGAEIEPIGRPPGELETLSLHLERVVAHLVAAIGAAVSEGDPAELISLARLACDVRDDPNAELLAEILTLLDLSEEVAGRGAAGAALRAVGQAPRGGDVDRPHTRGAAPGDRASVSAERPPQEAADLPSRGTGGVVEGVDVAGVAADEALRVGELVGRRACPRMAWSDRRARR